MDRVDALLDQYQQQLNSLWRRDVSGAERVWIAVYPPEIERRLRRRIEEFGLATRAAGKSWRHLDVTDRFAKWMSQQDYRESYFEEPELIGPKLKAFAAELEQELRDALTSPEVNDETVVALSGLGALFPMVRISELVQHVASDIRGRLLLFFPGALENGNYRLLDARDGWNYLAVPITLPEGTR